MLSKKFFCTLMLFLFPILSFAAMDSRLDMESFLEIKAQAKQLGVKEDDFYKLTMFHKEFYTEKITYKKLGDTLDIILNGKFEVNENDEVAIRYGKQFAMTPDERILFFLDLKDKNIISFVPQMKLDQLYFILIYQMWFELPESATKVVLPAPDPTLINISNTANMNKTQLYNDMFKRYYDFIKNNPSNIDWKAYENAAKQQEEADQKTKSISKEEKQDKKEEVAK